MKKLQVVYRPTFVRQYQKFPRELQEEVKEAIALFRRDPHNRRLRMHKLKGKLRGCYSFSVNYVFRIVFCYERKGTVALLVVGDHRIYR